MRSRLVLLAGAAFLAATHVVGVLLGSPAWPPAEVVALLLLAAYAAVGRAPRWIGPVALAPLIFEAALTVPRVHTGDYGWFVTDFRPEPSPWAVLLDALDTGFRLAGAPLLFAAVLLVAVRAKPASAARAQIAALSVGLPVVAYAVVRVVDTVLDLTDRATRGFAVGAAVLIPVILALTAAASLGAAVARRRPLPALGALLLTAATLPMIDSALAAVPLPYRAGDATRLFGWDFLTPSIVWPGPVPALTTALQLAGCLLLIGVTITPAKPIKPYDG